jgi:uncharacterized protein
MLAGIAVRLMGPEDRRFAWDLNQSEVPHVGSEEFEEFDRLCRISVFTPIATFDSVPAGFMLAMTADADYASPNFLWFEERYRAFLYVDRIAVTAACRKRGVGAVLYKEAERYALDHGLTMICCEVNLRPPNPGSLAFHRKLGFAQVGSQELVKEAKMVALLVKQLRAE